MRRATRCLWALCLSVAATQWALAVNPPDLLHAKLFDDAVDVSQYWVSEKLDGVRAYWDGQHLLSRNGNRFNAPGWFTRDFPDVALDGELWIQRGRFERVLSTVRKRNPVNEEWREIGYYIFDLPNGHGDFTRRSEMIKQFVSASQNPHLHAVAQWRIADSARLHAKLDEVISGGGEGLMLHREDALYRSGRSDVLLKLKRYQDAEATVLEHIPGKGRHKGRMGSLLVENHAGKRFKIGTGFSDAQRESPPKIGSTITYKHFGLTRNGIPRFASFLRQRQPL